MEKDFDRSFYTIPQAADLLQVHPNTLYNMVRRGEITTYKVGNQYRIPVRELAKMKVERRAPTSGIVKITNQSESDQDPDVVPSDT